MAEPRCSVTPGISLRQDLLCPEDAQGSWRRQRSCSWPHYGTVRDSRPVTVAELEAWARSWRQPWPIRAASEPTSARQESIRYVQARARQRHRWARDWGWESPPDWTQLPESGPAPHLLGLLLDFGDHWLDSPRPLTALAGLLASGWRQVEALTLGEVSLRPLLLELDQLTAIALGQWLRQADIPPLELG